MNIDDFFIEQAYSYSTSPETLDKLSREKNWRIRKAVASNQNTPIHTLEYLATDKSFNVRWALISNNNASDKALNKLLDNYNGRDTKSWIEHYNQWLTKHPNISHKILDRIAKATTSFFIKLDVIRSPKHHMTL